MSVSNSNRKIEIFFADDQPQNVKHLLNGIQTSGLIFKKSPQKEQLIVNLPDSKRHYEKNYKILHSDRCLINLDYATKIKGAIEKIKNKQSGYDLVICDLFFGENDEEYYDSKIGGIWPIYWAMHLSKNKKIVCKLYTGQLDRVVNHIDFKQAVDFLEGAYDIKIEKIEKSKDAKTWSEHLEYYLREVRKNIIPEITLDDRVEFINFLYSRLKQEHLNNKREADEIQSFIDDVLTLGKKKFKLINGQRMLLIHLFPILLGKHFSGNENRNFNNMTANQLDRTLYKNELVFNNREKRNFELNILRKQGIECEPIRRFDETGRPVYAIKLRKDAGDFGIISQIENSFIESLDGTFQIHQFFTRPKGFGHWCSSCTGAFLGKKEFDHIRNEQILVNFNNIRNFFEAPFSKNKEIQRDFSKQIEKALTHIQEKHFPEHKYDEQKIEHGFQKLERTSLLHPQRNDIILPLKALFRIKVKEFFKKVLNLREGTAYEKYESKEYQKISDSKFYWHCNAYAIRSGLKEIIATMAGEDAVFYLLESRCKTGKRLIKYKIILKFSGKGIPSIIRKFRSNTDGRLIFDDYFRGFCEMTIRSRMKGEEAIALSVFGERDEVPYSQMQEAGTEFEFTFAQGRER